MRYEYKKNKACTKQYIDKNGNKWTYIPAAAMNQQQEQSPIFFGDVLLKGEGSAVLTNEQAQLDLCNFQAQLPFWSKVEGYLPCTDESGRDGYVRILKSSGAIIAIIAILVLIGLITGGVLWGIFGNAGKIDLDEAAIAYQMTDGLKNTDPASIMMPSFSEINMKAGTREARVTLLNPEGNPCYFRYTIFLKDSGEQIYASKWIKPGTAITSITVSRDIEAGSYPISIHVDTGTLSDPDTPMNNAILEATLNVG